MPSTTTVAVPKTPAPTINTSQKLLQTSLESQIIQRLGVLASLEPETETLAPAESVQATESEPAPSGSGLARAYGDLGKAAASKGRLSKAAEYYTEALKADPSSSELHTELGLVLVQQNKLDDARRHFSEALELNPKNETAKENLERLTTL
jgi:Flp pilus assembly protein TadD